jgi:hypothetical protein
VEQNLEMTKKSKKELAILIVLIGLLSYSVLSQFSEERPAASLTRDLKKTAGYQAAGETVSVELLESETPEFTGVKRNIFQFGGGRAPVMENESYSSVPVPEPEVEDPVPHIPQVHYLGFYYEKETGLKMASLSNSERIYVGKTGQVIGGKYRILQIASDHVILKLVQDGRVIRVPLGKEAASILDWAEEQTE